MSAVKKGDEASLNTFGSWPHLCDLFSVGWWADRGSWAHRRRETRAELGLDCSPRRPPPAVRHPPHVGEDSGAAELLPRPPETKIPDWPWTAVQSLRLPGKGGATFPHVRGQKTAFLDCNFVVPRALQASARRSHAGRPRPNPGCVRITMCLWGFRGFSNHIALDLFSVRLRPLS